MLLSRHNLRIVCKPETEPGRLLQGCPSLGRNRHWRRKRCIALQLPTKDASQKCRLVSERAMPQRLSLSEVLHKNNVTI
jgi:hypothetical protein